MYRLAFNSKFLEIQFKTVLEFILRFDCFRIECR